MEDSEPSQNTVPRLPVLTSSSYGYLATSDYACAPSEPTPIKATVMPRQYFLPFCIGSLLITLTRLDATPLPNPAPVSLMEQRRLFLPVTDTTYHLFPVSDNTYGYNILINNKVLIHQPAIPGVPGNKSFASLADAEKVAKLAIRKIKQGLVPPTIKKRELDSLKIKYRL